MLDDETGELVERRLEHESGEARAFYAALSGPVRVGGTCCRLAAVKFRKEFEAPGYSRSHLIGATDQFDTTATVDIGAQCAVIIVLCYFTTWFFHNLPQTSSQRSKGITDAQKRQ